ncbi:MAG TPA: hypothetical protein VL987_12370 [Cellvibrio sp.]|nr:hypothetical protein [Cellvibrio sp.]
MLLQTDQSGYKPSMMVRLVRVKVVIDRDEQRSTQGKQGQASGQTNNRNDTGGFHDVLLLMTFNVSWSG